MLWTAPCKSDRQLSNILGVCAPPGKGIDRGVTIEIDDTRKDYGEHRIICYRMLDGRLVVVGYTPGGDTPYFQYAKSK